VNTYSDYSIVMTSFNAAETIERAIVHAVDLIPEPKEVIVIDDFSSDSTWNTLLAISKRFSRVSVHRNSYNQGQSYSRNQGLLLSQSEFVIFMDDDDLSLPIRARVHLKHFQQGVGLSFVSSIKTYANGYSVENISPNVNSEAMPARELIRRLISGKKSSKVANVYCPSSTLAVSKPVFDALGGFDVTMRRLEDIDFVCRASSANYSIAWSSEVGVIRADTFGLDKNSAKNAEGERVLLNRFRNNLSKREWLSESVMISLRKLYFGRQWLLLILMLPKWMMLGVIDFPKILSIYRRIVHDLKQRKSGK